MKTHKINALVILFDVLYGIAGGWLCHFDVVPKTYLIIAAVVMVLLTAAVIVLFKRGLVKQLLMRVPAIVMSVGNFCALLALLDSYSFFSPISEKKMLVSVIISLFCALYTYVMLKIQDRSK